MVTERLYGANVRLKRVYNPNLTQIHCVAHKLVLTAGQAGRDIALISDYQLTLKNMYRYFANSAVCYNELRAMQDIMEDEGMEYLPIKELTNFQ